MESGRMPACDAVPFDGEYTTSVRDEVLTGRDATKCYPSNQGRIGNGCNHDKNNFKKPVFHGMAKRRPPCLEEAKRRIDAALLDHFRYPMFSGLFYHCDKDGAGTGRHIRSERVEGIHGLALPTLLQTLNLGRMACGHYDNKNEFRFYNYSYIENQTGQSAIRVKREMRLLQERGIIKVNTLREQNNDGSWRTTRVEIEFTDKIFEMLDLMDEFLKDRETILIKFHEKQERLDRNRQKKDLYRKPSFRSRKPEVDNKDHQGLQRLTQKLTINHRKVDKGHGLEIRDRINDLVSRGMSVAEAMDIVRNGKPPPH